MPVTLRELMVKYGMPIVVFDNQALKPETTINQLIIAYNAETTGPTFMLRAGNPYIADNCVLFAVPDIYQVEIDIECFEYISPKRLAHLCFVQLIEANPVQNKWLFDMVREMRL
jgi:hypothetical protein